jgi:hypothetical protein
MQSININGPRKKERERGSGNGKIMKMAEDEFLKCGSDDDNDVGVIFIIITE